MGNVYGIRVIVEISNIAIINGDGTLTIPYIENTSKATNVSDIAVGEYISIPKSDEETYLVRVVKHDQGGTKVILNGLYNTNKPKSVSVSVPTANVNIRYK